MDGAFETIGRRRYEFDAMPDFAGRETRPWRYVASARCWRRKAPYVTAAVALDRAAHFAEAGCYVLEERLGKGTRQRADGRTDFGALGRVQREEGKRLLAILRERVAAALVAAGWTRQEWDGRPDAEVWRTPEGPEVDRRTALAAGLKWVGAAVADALGQLERSEAPAAARLVDGIEEGWTVFAERRHGGALVHVDRRTLHPGDVCECGDRRVDHAGDPIRGGTGRCLLKHERPCGRFEIAVAFNPNARPLTDEELAQEAAADLRADPDGANF